MVAGVVIATSIKAASATPSVGRRVVFILGCALVVTVLSCLLVGVLAETRLISAACVDRDLCASRDDFILYSVVIGWLVACLAVLLLGRLGRLYGCRLAEDDSGLRATGAYHVGGGIAEVRGKAGARDPAGASKGLVN